jgi:hypothetical protein
MMPVATGIILVLVKKKSTSCVLRTGRTDRAYAAGVAGSRIWTEATGTTIELPAYAQKACLERAPRTTGAVPAS